MAPQPSQRLLGLLHTELPWTTTLGDHTPSDTAPRPSAPDLDAALTQLRRVHPALLDDQLRASLTRADQLQATIRGAYQRHLDATWLRDRHQDRDRHIEDRDRGIDI